MTSPLIVETSSSGSQVIPSLEHNLRISTLPRTINVRFVLEIFDRQVALVANLTDDFLQDILERNDAFHAAVLIHDDGQVALRFLVGPEKLRQRHTVRDNQCILQNRTPVWFRHVVL